MKFLYALSLIAILPLFVSCQNKKDMLIKKWKLIDINEKKDNNELYEPSSKKTKAEIRKELIQKIKLEFKKDGKFIVYGRGESEIGTYKLSEDEKQILLKGKKAKKEERFTVEEIADTKLILRIDNDTLVFIPAIN